MQLLQGTDQIEERTAPPIKTPDDDGIEVTPARRLQDLLTLRASLGARANFLLFNDDFPSATPGDNRVYNLSLVTKTSRHSRLS
jgi:hypothetical protein